MGSDDGGCGNKSMPILGRAAELVLTSILPLAPACSSQACACMLFVGGAREQWPCIHLADAGRESLLTLTGWRACPHQPSATPPHPALTATLSPSAPRCSLRGACHRAAKGLQPFKAGTRQSPPGWLTLFGVPGRRAKVHQYVPSAVATRLLDHEGATRRADPPLITRPVASSLRWDVRSPSTRGEKITPHPSQGYHSPFVLCAAVDSTSRASGRRPSPLPEARHFRNDGWATRVGAPPILFFLGCFRAFQKKSTKRKLCLLVDGRAGGGGIERLLLLIEGRGDSLARRYNSHNGLEVSGEQQGALRGHDAATPPTPTHPPRIQMTISAMRAGPAQQRA